MAVFELLYDDYDIRTYYYSNVKLLGSLHVSKPLSVVMNILFRYPFSLFSDTPVTVDTLSPTVATSICCLILFVILTLSPSLNGAFPLFLLRINCLYSQLLRISQFSLSAFTVFDRVFTDLFETLSSILRFYLFRQRFYLVLLPCCSFRLHFFLINVVK